MPSPASTSRTRRPRALSRGDRHVRVRPSGPPLAYARLLGGRLQEAVRREGPLSSRFARKDGNAPRGVDQSSPEQLARMAHDAHAGARSDARATPRGPPRTLGRPRRLCIGAASFSHHADIIAVPSVRRHGARRVPLPGDAPASPLLHRGVGGGASRKQRGSSPQDGAPSKPPRRARRPTARPGRSLPMPPRSHPQRCGPDEARGVEEGPRESRMTPGGTALAGTSGSSERSSQGGRAIR